ncbi:uncharacterized protein [Choristoneura fumiferana]|uniref:uncharacterized protein n=1 Tax=Choristoneura fumiferana TaxID=7141 RepID=UPI003D15E6A6
MCGSHKVRFLCVVFLLGAKVDAYFNDALNPIKDALEVWNVQRNARVAHRSANDNIYICEEVPDTVPPELNKTCNYRNTEYHEQVYKWVAGRGCLQFTPAFLYINGTNTLNLNSACFYGEFYAPCLEIAKEDGTIGCYPFDPGLVEVARAVRNALIPAAHGRWERCFDEASHCCSHYMGTEVPEDETSEEISDSDEDTTSYCRATFDGWTCWQTADGGTVAFEVCSEFAYSNQGPSCHHYSNKECHRNGSWELQTDYSTCSITSRLLRRYRFYIAMLAFSIASCLPAIFVFFFYKRLRVTRVALHRNLLIAIVIRNMLVIISRSVVYIDELTNAGDTVMSTHAVGCRVLAILERIAANAVFVCMLVEGVYLHRLIVAVFKRKLNVTWLYAAGAVIAVVPVVAWSVVMGIHDNHSCWVVYTIDNIQWILDAPRLAILVINTVLFIDVLRVLLTKIRNSENANQLSTTKATLFLMPIFGSQFLLTAFRPSTTNCVGEQAYYYVTYTVEGLQGFIVALLYCYVNKEVRMLVKATYKKTEEAVVSRVRGESYNRPSIDPNSRRLTCSTNIPSHYGEEKDNPVAPNIHVAEIISIQASERLAEILEPIYETIESGVANEGYDSLERGASYPANMDRVDDYYGFAAADGDNANQGWMRCVSSPESSVFNSSHSELDKRNNEKNSDYDDMSSGITNDNHKQAKNPKDTVTNYNYPDPEDLYELNQPDNPLNVEDNASMLEAIMQYIETNENKDVELNPDLLSPNRKPDDKIMFVDINE